MDRHSTPSGRPIREGRTGAGETRSVGALFVMIGAEPNTAWLDGCLPLDRCGFVRTGQDGDGLALASPYATTTPGIYAVGDVRSGSVKRVASGVGEGSVVVQAMVWLDDEQGRAHVRDRTFEASPCTRLPHGCPGCGVSEFMPARTD